MDIKKLFALATAGLTIAANTVAYAGDEPAVYDGAAVRYKGKIIQKTTPEGESLGDACITLTNEVDTGFFSRPREIVGATTFACEKGNIIVASTSEKQSGWDKMIGVLQGTANLVSTVSHISAEQKFAEAAKTTAKAADEGDMADKINITAQGGAGGSAVANNTNTNYNKNKNNNYNKNINPNKKGCGYGHGC